MEARAERGMSEPPEVVFNTAIDPSRVAAWLPTPLRQPSGRQPEVMVEDLRARWTTGSRPDWSAQLQVQPLEAGGSRVRLDLAVAPDDRGNPAGEQLGEIADESLASLAREAADNLSAG